MLRNIVCPVSAERLNKRACRVGATLSAGVLTLFFATHWWPVIAFVVFDYVVRVFTSRTAPIALVANGIVHVLRLEPVQMDKAPKVFAWRIGFLMAVAAGVAFPLSATASGFIALALAGFNVLDGICNFCVGCIIYTYLILPRLGAAPVVESV